MVKVYIDGQEGTTGLKILERFEGRNEFEIVAIRGIGYKAVRND